MSVKGYGKGMPPSGMMPSMSVYTNGMPPSGMMASYGKGVPPSGMMPSYGKGMPPSGMMPSYGKGMPPSGMMPSYGKGMPPSGTMQAMPGYSKGMPASGMMMSKGMPQMQSMPNQGMMPFSQQGKMDWELEQEQGFFGGWSAEEDVVSRAPRSFASMTTPHSMTTPQEQMMPIPWQREKPDEDAKYREQDHSLEHLNELSIDQLQEMALTRKSTIENLKREVNNLEIGDGKHDARLVALEKKFGELCTGSDLEFKAPLLSKIATMVRESHLLDHEAEMARIKEGGAAEEWAELDPWAYIHSDNFVLGRGLMRLDQHHIAKMAWKQKLKDEEHPVVDRMHYAGHVAKPAKDVESIFCKEAGIFKRQPLHPAPYRNGFWLSLDGPTRDDAAAAQKAKKEAMDDPVAKRIMRQNIAGTGEDAQAVDWLGKIKHGEMIDDSPPHNPGFVMPSWMY